jgi:hypothetical protein
MWSKCQITESQRNYSLVSCNAANAYNAAKRIPSRTNSGHHSNPLALNIDTWGDVAYNKTAWRAYTLTSGEGVAHDKTAWQAYTLTHGDMLHMSEQLSLPFFE